MCSSFQNLKYSKMLVVGGFEELESSGSLTPTELFIHWPKVVRYFLSPI